METYREEQRFDQWWLRILIGGLAIGCWWLLLQQVVAAVDIGSEPAPDWVLVVLWVGFGIVFPAWFFSLRLVSIIDDSGVDSRFKPSWGSFRLSFEETGTFTVVHYNPTKEFGGWGARVGRNGSRALNVSGTRGVRITTVDGSMRLFGSQTPEELVAAIGFHRGCEPRAS